MGADWIIFIIVGLAFGLLLAAWLKSKFKNYKLISPIKKVEHRKRKPKTAKKRKSLVIRLG